MECEEVREHVGVLLTAGERTPWPAPLDRHLQGCPECQGAVEDLGRTWDLLRQWPEVGPSAEVRRRLLASLRREVVRETVLTVRGWVPAVLASAIGVGLSLVLSLLVHYPALVRLCRQLLQVSDQNGAPYLFAGVVYGIPLAVGAWILRREALPQALIGSLEASLLFLLVLAPYVIAECREFAPSMGAAFFSGLAGGAVASGLLGLWLAHLRKPAVSALLALSLLAGDPVPGTAGSLRADIDGLRVELTSLPDKPKSGREMTYTVRLSDRGDAPVNGAKVTLRGRMADGMTVLAPLLAAPEPGVYRGRLLFTMEGRWDLTLRIATGKSFEFPLIEQVEP